MSESRLILASSSPRRHEILSRLTSEFTAVPADIDETPRDNEPAEAYVVRLAEEKALAVLRPGRVVVGADTVVVLDGQILGKPRDRAEAEHMLRRLSGRDHLVMSGVAVATHEAGAEPLVRSERETSVVTFGPIDEALLGWYLATGEGDDKAGAYGLQGRGGVFADLVAGSVTNVVGLPLPLLYEMLVDAGVLPWDS